MAFKADDVVATDHLLVGKGFPLALGIKPKKINGAAYIEGPAVIGNFTIFPVPEANVMIGRCINPSALPPPASILKVTSRGLPPTPIDVMLGDPAGPVGIQAWCGPMPFYVQAATIDLITGNYSLFGSAIFRTGPSIDVGAKLFTGPAAEFSVNSKFDVAFTAAPVLGDAPYINPDTITYAGVTINQLQATKKSFDIPHPTKEGYRLRYVCLEGPSADVFYRGKLEGNTVIHLPEYWEKLVDPDSITVTLTPIGSYQELFVDRIENSKTIHIRNNASGIIKCHYIVYGERIDTTKNITEYKGTSKFDYPENNIEYSINR